MRAVEARSKRDLPLGIIIVGMLMALGFGAVLSLFLKSQAGAAPLVWERLGLTVLCMEAIVYALVGVLVGVRRAVHLLGFVAVGMVLRGMMAASAAAFAPKAAQVQTQILAYYVQTPVIVMGQVLCVVLGLNFVKHYFIPGPAEARPEPEPAVAAPPVAAPVRPPAPDVAESLSEFAVSAPPAAPPRPMPPAPQPVAPVLPPPPAPVAPGPVAAAPPPEPAPPPVVEAPPPPPAPPEEEMAPELVAEHMPSLEVPPALEAPEEPEWVEETVPVEPEIEEVAEPEPWLAEELAEAEAPTIEVEPDAGPPWPAAEVSHAEPGERPEQSRLEALVSELMEGVADVEDVVLLEEEPEPQAVEEPEAEMPLFGFEAEETVLEVGAAAPEPPASPMAEEPIVGAALAEPGPAWPAALEPEPEPEEVQLAAFDFEPVAESVEAAAPVAAWEPETPALPLEPLAAVGALPPEPAAVAAEPVPPEPIAEEPPVAEPEPALHAAAVPAPPAAPPGMVRVTAEYILPQLPPGALSPSALEDEEALASLTFDVSLDAVLRQLPEGEARVPVDAITRQMPRGTLALSDAELSAALMDGIELPLWEVVPQLPGDALSQKAPVVDAPVLDGDDIFKQEQFAGFTAAVYEPQPTAPAEPPAPEMGEPAAPQPAAPVAEARAEPPRVEPPYQPPPAPADAVRISVQAILSQFPPKAFVKPVALVAESMSAHCFFFAREPLVAQLRHGRVTVPVVEATPQLPPHSLAMDVEAIVEAIGTRVELPLHEVVPQLLEAFGAARATEIPAAAPAAAAEPPPAPEPPAMRPPEPAPAVQAPPPAAVPTGSEGSQQAAVAALVERHAGSFGPVRVDWGPVPGRGLVLGAVPQRADVERARELAATLWQDAVGLAQGCARSGVLGVQISADAGAAALVAAPQSPGVICQVAAAGERNIGLLGFAARKILDELPGLSLPAADLPMPAEPAAGRTATQAGGNGHLVDQAAAALGAPIPGAEYCDDTGWRLLALGLSDDSFDLASWVKSALRTAAAYAEATGIGAVGRAILETPEGPVGLMPPGPQGRAVLLVVPRTTRTGLLSVQIGRVSAAVG